MPVYRLTGTDGRTRTVTAGRVVLSDGEVRFQSSSGDHWTAVAVTPLHEVRRLQRRFNEADGRLRWVDERDINDAAAASRPEPAQVQPQDASVADPAPEPTVAAANAPAAHAATTPPPVVSASDVRCPQCGEDEELSGRRTDGDIVLTCHRCGHVGPRAAQRRCGTCGGSDVVERPKAVVERARGTQLTVVGYSTIGLCRTCDEQELTHSLQTNGAVLPEELPTVDPETLRLMRQGQRANSVVFEAGRHPTR